MQTVDCSADERSQAGDDHKGQLFVSKKPADACVLWFVKSFDKKPLCTVLPSRTVTSFVDHVEIAGVQADDVIKYSCD